MILNSTDPTTGTVIAANDTHSSSTVQPTHDLSVTRYFAAGSVIRIYTYADAALARTTNSFGIARMAAGPAGIQGATGPQGPAGPSGDTWSEYTLSAASTVDIPVDSNLYALELLLDGVHSAATGANRNISARLNGRSSSLTTIMTGAWSQNTVSGNPPTSESFVFQNNGIVLARTWQQTVHQVHSEAYLPIKAATTARMAFARSAVSPNATQNLSTHLFTTMMDNSTEAVTSITIDFGGGTFTGKIRVRSADGAPGIVWRGAWAAATVYAANDGVTYQGSTYRRRVGGTTSTPPPGDATNWELLAAAATGSLLAVQSDFGANNAYSSAPGGEYAVKNTGVYLQIDYTPAVNAWWEVEGQILMRCDAAAYSGAYSSIKLIGTDADGNANPYRGSDYATQHSGVNLLLTRFPKAVFKLTAGVAYSARIRHGVDSGTWSHHMGVDYLQLLGKAYAR